MNIEKFEKAPKEPQTTEHVVSQFINGNNEVAISFLKDNKNEIGEFCLQVRDAYGENDKSTPFLKLAEIINLIIEKPN
jgi:hypothetical protein